MKKLWIGTVTAFVLIAASWIGNLRYFQAHQLGEPTFLEHHIEVLKEQGDTFELYYLEDIHGEKKINSIYFPDYPEMTIEAHNPAYSKYTHQQMGMFMISILSDSPDNKESNTATGPQIIETVLVHYNDGSSAEKNIGEIRLIDGQFDHGKKQSPINGTSSGGSSDSTGFNSFYITRPAELQSIESSYLDLIDTNQLDLYFDYQLPASKGGVRSSDMDSTQIEMLGRPLKEIQLPVQFVKGDSIRFSYEFKLNPEELGKAYRLRLQLGLKDRNGEQWTEFIPLSFNPPYFTEAQMRSLVREKREQP